MLTPVVRYVYHTTDQRAIHDGPELGCPVCLRQKKEDVARQKRGDLCRCICGAVLSRRNKSGMCIRCMRQMARRRAEERVHPRCQNLKCKKKLDYRNTSGYCRPCFVEMQTERRKCPD